MTLLILLMSVKVFQHEVNVKFFWRCCVLLVRFSCWSHFQVNIVTGSRVMTIFLYKDRPEIREPEIPTSEFCPISGDWDKLGIPSLAGMSLMKFYWMLQNARVTAFTVFQFLSTPPLPPPSTHTHSTRNTHIHTHTHTQIRVKVCTNLFHMLYLELRQIPKILILKEANRAYLIMSGPQIFFLRNFCQGYMWRRHQSLKYCNGNTYFL